ncbi:kinase-like domain-containing protein [Zychaea mexicana]|uniref:kinase-like domain-containing protein n=1 Tax=Zychaea mexicana TaxID=64656 RepID=UPI0022FF0C85|nr:kinase-like domain-containing protein [Zychaea mexicana]KAI9497034.1 kinase-like domain-containing protein [Zychaea mexicana]
MSYDDDDDYESDYSYGDSVRSDDEEDLEDYKKGGYHPVSIGDRLNHDRYIVVRKLGWGHFSTVWLAYDTEKKRHVALKIVKSARHFTDSAKEEIKLLEAVKVSDPNDAGWKHVAQMLDHFTHSGPNGKHVCMAFEVLGENLLSVIKRYHYKGIPVPIVKRIAKQLLLGLDYLHRKCGIIHTDLKPENVLVCIPNVEQLLTIETADLVAKLNLEAEKEKKQKEKAAITAVAVAKAKAEAKTVAAKKDDHQQSAPSQEPQGPMSKSRKKRLKKKAKQKAAKEAAARTVAEGGGSAEQQPQQQATKATPIEKLKIDQPKVEPSASPSNDTNNNNNDKHETVDTAMTIIPSAVLGSTLEDFERIEVKIADLGNACWVDEENTHIIQTRQYRSPEVIVGCRWNDRADMWSFASLIFELLTGEFLFHPEEGREGGESYCTDDDHLAQIIELMQPGPHSASMVPRSLTAEGEDSKRFFTRKGELRRIKRLRYRRLRDVIHDQYAALAPQADEISEFLLPMLEMDLRRRAGAADMLKKSEWFIAKEE